AVERELLERLPAARAIGSGTRARVGIRKGGAERIPQRIGGVFECLELLHYRQRFERRRRTCLDLGHPLFQVRCIARRAGDSAGAADKGQRQCSAEEDSTSHVAQAIRMSKHLRSPPGCRRWCRKPWLQLPVRRLLLRPGIDTFSPYRRAPAGCWA